MQPLEIDNPFWQFSLRVYGEPGVAEECLAVQDKLGADINVVLYAVWLGARRGIVLEQGDLARIDEVVAAWSANVVQSLREVRRDMKTMPEAADLQVQALRKRVADSELFSEQIEQALLFQLATSIGRAAAASDATARGNVLSVLARHGADATAFPLQKLLAAAGAAVA
jgi:uncharacterized protein (TIGR02444 family)